MNVDSKLKNADLNEANTNSKFMNARLTSTTTTPGIYRLTTNDNDISDANDNAMLEAHKSYKEMSDPYYSPFGKVVKVYLPAHGDLNCPCNKCILFRISNGDLR